MSYVIPGTCPQCKATGLPILPVRYSVVPKDIVPALPEWASGDRVSSVDLGADFHYALRLMRTGYIYLFYEKNARGRDQWECYSVGEDGSLVRFQEWRHARPQETPVLRCLNHGPVNTQVHYLVIEQPEKCGTTWIAFTHDKWSEETVAQYTVNTTLRNARMQSFHPSKMVTGVKHPHGAVASAQTLAQVLEYSPTLSTALLPHDAVTGELSDESGKHKPARLREMSTRYPWALRPYMAEDTARHMRQRAKAAGGEPGTPHVLALWDAMGITHELNGFRNDAAGWIAKYGDERALQLHALDCIDGLQTALENRAVSQADAHIATVQGLSNPLDNRELRARSMLRDDPNDKTAHKELADIQAERMRIAQAQIHAAEDLRKGYVAAAWPSYFNRLDPAVHTFRASFKAFETDAADLIDRRTRPLIRWLEAGLFIDSLNDFHGENDEDCLLFNEAIGEAVYGIGSCHSGKKKIEEWVDEAKATIQGNLLWRAMALNHKDVRSELDAALVEARQHHAQQTEATAIAWLGYTQKSLKAFADIYKRAQRLLDTNGNAEQGRTVFGARLKPVNMRGLDKAVVTFGDAVFRRFRIDKLGDYASEKIIQHIFLIRGFVNPADSINLIMAQAQQEGLLRAETLKRIRTARSFMAADTPAIRSAQANQLNGAWNKVLSDVDTPTKAQAAANAMLESRLAVTVGLIEAMNFAKLMHACWEKNDMKSWFSLLASGMTITSALFDVAAVTVKNMKLGSSSWTHQALKLKGGVLSGGASFIGAVIDWAEASKYEEKGYSRLAFLLDVKAAGGVASTVLSLIVAFTYSAPLVGRLLGRGVVTTAIENAGKRAAAVIAFRVLGMAVGTWVTAGMFAVQVTIWIVTPDALEKWIDHSAFGKKRSTGGFRTADEQEKGLYEALVEMGMAEKRSQAPVQVKSGAA